MQNEQINIQSENDREVSKVKNTLKRYFKKWPWILLSVVIALILSFFYLKFKPNVYSVETTVKVKGNNQFNDPNDLLFGRVSRSPFGKNQDEAQVMQSFPLIQSAVEKLGLNIEYYEVGSLNKKELYQSKPIELKYQLAANEERFNCRFEIEIISDSKYLLSSPTKISGLDVSGEYSFDEKIEAGDYSFTLQKNEKEFKSGRIFEINLKSPQIATYKYQSNIEVEEPYLSTLLFPLKQRIFSIHLLMNTLPRA